MVDVDEGGACLSVRNASLPSKAIRCTYDRVFNADSTQEDVFKGLAPALDTVLEGYNACVLAYGQTGSGKTHTLIGELGRSAIVPAELVHDSEDVDATSMPHSADCT